MRQPTTITPKPPKQKPCLVLRRVWLSAPMESPRSSSRNSYGGWIGAPIDYLRFLLAIDGERGPRLLNERSVRQMLSRPSLLEAPALQASFYGLRFSARDIAANRKNWWHTGSQPGYFAFGLRTVRGHSWVVAFNSRPRDQEGFFRALDASLWSAAKRVGNWPDNSTSCAAYVPNPYAFKTDWRKSGNE